MNISEFFIRRATTTTLVMAALAAFGVIGYRSLPVSDLPNVDFPTISVSASLPGASPETMAERGTCRSRPASRWCRGSGCAASE